MKWEIGDRLRILDSTKIVGRGLDNDDIYGVIGITDSGTPIILTIEDTELYFDLGEMPYVERVTNSEDSDIKSMIGRLLKKGYEMAPVDDGGDAE